MRFFFCRFYRNINALIDRILVSERENAALARMRGCLRACGLLGALKGRLTKSPPESMSEMAPFRVLPAFQSEWKRALSKEYAGAEQRELERLYKSFAIA